MYNRVIFYNHFGAGDLFESREFVKEIMHNILAEGYIYAHRQNPRIFFDFPNLLHTGLTAVTKPDKSFLISNNDLYINTWIGRDPKYVLPGIGCVVDQSLKMFNEILMKIKVGALKGGSLEYLPCPDFSGLNLENTTRFITSNKDKRIILICNGEVLSKQAENFDFTGPINNLADNHAKDVFVVTADFENKPDNVHFIGNVVKDRDGFELNDISFLAEHSAVIIGRKSGPFVFAHTRNVWYNGKIKSLSFTYRREASHFVKQDDLPLRKYWSPCTSEKDVTEKMESVLND